MANSDKKLVGLSKKEKKEKRPRKKGRGKKILNAFLILMMLLGITVMITILGFCGYIVMSAPEFDTDLLYNKEASILYDINGKEFARLGAEQRELVSYEDLPEVLIDAIVATEDSRYFQHNGFDVVRFTKASLGQIAGQSNAGGASTLTMQVVKNTFTSTEASGIKGIIRKFTDIYMSVFKIEKNYTKEEIIEFYVNAPFLGSGTYGVEQACQVYFGKSVKDISLPEAALIAGIFNAPSSYNPYHSIDLATKRRDTVLNLMYKHGYITEEQKLEASKISIESLIKGSHEDEWNEYQSYIDTVIEDVQEKTGISPYDSSMLIYTTLDPNIQNVLNDLNAGKIYSWVDDYIQIGLVITSTKDGSILAVDGGRHQNTQRAYNRATRMKTQPGSTIKPIIDYGPYLEYNNGSTGTIFYDVPYTYSNGQKITNSDNSYGGAMTMRTALVQSRNIPALQAFQAVDKEKIGEFVHNCGINYGDDLYEAYSIGGGLAVSPLDMAAAYGTFARGGYYIEPYTFTKIVLLQTDEIIEHKVEKVQAMSPETAYMITDMLVSATKNGVGGNLNVSGTEIASKTGTSTYNASALKAKGVPSSASADNWVITYSPDYVISFDYMYDELSKEHYTDSIRAAIQRKKISAVIGNKIYKKNSKFSKPSSLVSAKYEKESAPAELPSEFTPESLIGTELFKKGNEPNTVSERFSQLSNPSNATAIENDGIIEITWNGISTPKPISETYLKEYFNKSFGKASDKFLQKRIEYNNSSIGTVGYEVFVVNEDGSSTSLGFTNDTKMEYKPTKNGNYNFIIKSEYSIFKANASPGATASANVSSFEEIIPQEPENEIEKENETTPAEDDKKEENNSTDLD